MGHRSETHTAHASPSTDTPQPEPTHDGMEWIFRPGFGWVSRIVAPALTLDVPGEWSHPDFAEWAARQEAS